MKKESNWRYFNKLLISGVMVTVGAFSAVGTSSAQAAETENFPFPQHVDYHSGVIKPTNYTQQQLDQQVEDAYDNWKSKYLLEHPTKSNMSYVRYNESGHPYAEGAATVSEAHGYGMLTLVYMAGHDPESQDRFDDMFRYFKEYPSQHNANLMGWQQEVVNGDIVNRSDHASATDGDLDIAYSLLLADKQWGSDGTINYLAEAKKVINALMDEVVHKTEWTLKLGDWAEDNDATWGTATRTSDWAINHLRAFEEATGDQRWSNVIDATYNVNSHIHSNYSQATGLMPDFAYKRNGSFKPVDPFFIELEHDGEWYYNAARTPWRVATDYIVSGDDRALTSLSKTNTFIRNKSNNTPGNVTAGYSLDGQALNNWSPQSTYLAPLGVNAMVSSSNQTWLNKLWDTYVGTTQDDSYYSDSIELLGMIVMSGNWWTPDTVTIPEPAPEPEPDPEPVPEDGLTEVDVPNYPYQTTVKLYLHTDHSDDAVTMDYINPQTVTVTHEVKNSEGDVEWFKINTWLGSRYIKNVTAEPTPTPSEPELVEKDVTNYSYAVNTRRYLHDTFDVDSKTTNYIDPQTVTVTHVVEDVNNGNYVTWLKINTWLGSKYIKPNSDAFLASSPTTVKETTTKRGGKSKRKVKRLQYD